MAVGLAEQLAAALRAGDLGAAKVAHEALGKLLGGEGKAAGVVDLAERRKGKR